MPKKKKKNYMRNILCRNEKSTTFVQVSESISQKEFKWKESHPYISILLAFDLANKLVISLALFLT